MPFKIEDVDWLRDTVEYLKLTEKPHVASLLQREIDVLLQQPQPKPQRSFRGKLRPVIT